MGPKAILTGIFVVVLLVAAERPAAAQPAGAAGATAQVVDLNRQAMAAYTSLEMERALQLLSQALELCRANAVTGAPLARTHLNRGVVQVGGLADNAAGIDSFADAMRADPNVRLDPITSTPDIEAAFALARQRAASTAPGAPLPPVGTAAPGVPLPPGATAAPGAPLQPGATAAPGPPGPPGGGSLISHTPPAEQLEMTPVPIYLEVAPYIRVGAVYVWYRGLGMPDFQRVQAQQVGNGYGAEIDCMAAFAPQIVYYVGIIDPQGVPVTYAGDPANPIPVPIVSARTREAPHLPDRPPPETCTAGSTDECPPGSDDPRCRRALCGDGRCEGSEDFTCPQDCIPGAAVEDTTPRLPSAFIALGVGAGAGTARTQTMTNPSQDALCDDTLRDLPPGEIGSEDADLACVDVQGGFTFLPPALRIAGGFFVTDQISLGASLRYQVIGESHAPIVEALKMLDYHVEVRGSYWFNRTLETSLWFYGFAGTGYGMVQPQVNLKSRPLDTDGDGEPDSGEEDVTIYQNAGFNNFSLGGGVLYHFGDPGGLALIGEVDADYFFPTVVMAIDAWVGVEHGF